ncbi:hypothetical protein M569_13671, partial [Genlisea aurea]
VVTSKGYPEDVRLSNIRLFLGAIVIVIALFAQFYNKKFPENRNFLMACIASYPFFYVVVNGVLQVIIRFREKNAIMFTYPPPGIFTSTGLRVTSKLPRFSDIYTLTIASADPQSKSAKPSVQLSKSVTQWFTKDGVLVEGLVWKDVEALLEEYAKGTKKSK